MISLIRPFYYEPIKHLYYLISKKEYRTHVFLQLKFNSVKRYQEKKIKLDDWELLVPDVVSFLSSYREIFVREIYAFVHKNNSPLILDLGANIGLSVLYFKKLYPEAQITAFEADPIIFRYLIKNVHGNGYEDVRLINKAAWNNNKMVDFHSDQSDAGRIAFGEDPVNCNVEAIDIRDYLKVNKVDFLKIDIEGAEEIVFPLCDEYLHNIDFVFIEYHSRVNFKQKLHLIFSILEKHGFRIHIQSDFCSPRPFVTLNTSSGLDMRLNIHAWKDK